MPHIVAIQQIGVPVHPRQPLFDQIGDGRLARARKPGEPQHGGLLVLEVGMEIARHVGRLPMDILCPAQREVQHARCDGGIADLVDQDEAAQRPVLFIGLEHDLLVGRQVGDTDGVQFQRLGRQMFHRIDVDLIFGLLDGRGDHLRPDLKPVGAARQHFLVRHPHDGRFELVGGLGRIVGQRDHVAARTVDLVGEAERDRLARNGFVQIAVQRDDAADGAGLARRQHADRVARLDRAGRDQAGKATEVEIGAVDPLYGHTERLFRVSRAVDLDRFQMFDQCRASIPGRIFRRAGDIVALEPGNRHRRERRDADRLGEFGIVGDDRVEHALVIADQIHLVDGQHDVADADQVGEIAVAARLGQDALARVDQDDGEVGGGRTRHHVAGILFVAGRVGDDELALFGGEEAIGDVDRDALFALGGEAIDQQGEVDLLPLRAHLLAVGGQRFELILEDHLAVIEQAADQRRLAVIHRPAGDEAQHRLMLMHLEIGVDILGNEGVGLVDGVCGNVSHVGFFHRSP